MLARSIWRQTRSFTSKYYNSTKIFKMSLSQSLQNVAKVDIDTGIFKYILIEVYDPTTSTPDNEPSVVIVRGYKDCEYHSDILDKVQEQLTPLDCKPLGGGRINHETEERKIHIYGYSQGFGKADHEITAKLIKDAFPAYTITISDEGY